MANSRLTTAVHALCWLELSRRRGVPVLSSDKIASSLRSHPVLVRRCLASLKDAGLVSSSRGPGAGFSLGKRAADITLRDVQAAVDDQPVFDLHPHEPDVECEVGSGIRPVLATVFDDVEQAMGERLAGYTVEAVLDSTLAFTGPDRIQTR